MRRLLILRHAKAEPGVGSEDFDRALTADGERDAARIGEHIERRGWRPDLILSSGSERTRATTRLVAERLGAEVETSYENLLYDATRHLLLARIRELPDEARTVLIVGHNPAAAEGSNWFVGSGDPDARRHMAAKFPPCGLAALTFPVAHWAEVEPRTGVLEAFVTASELAVAKA